MRSDQALRAVAFLGLGALIAAGPGAQDAASRAFMEASDRMSHDMAKPMTGDADTDFASMMIAHHQGAIDMAKVELQYGKDPELRQLAQGIVDAQTKEITQLQRWLEVRKPAR
jgi:uncharacterized protein (DUF305 family)